MTMEFLSSATPAYKGTNAQPPTSTGLLSGLGLVSGSGTPSYKTLGSNGAQASAPSRSWWQVFSTATPVYKTAPTATVGGDPDTSSLVDDPDPDCGGVDDQVPQVVIL